MLYEHMTYNDLDNQLQKLGFAVEVQAGKSRTYRHAASGAIIPLADRPGDSRVLPHHLAAVRGVLKIYGLDVYNGELDPASRRD